MEPYERSLVQRLKDKPFAWLGVNVDEKKPPFEGQPPAWRCWWDRDGMIAGQWEVQGLPTLVVIDAKGVIRHRIEGFPVKHPGKFDQLIDELIAETEAQTTARAATP